MLDARELLLDPRAVLGELCRRLGLRFDEAMLRWKRRTAARGWRLGAALVRQRAPLDGFRALPADRRAGSRAACWPLIEECTPYYERLLESAIVARGAARATS